MSVPLVMKSDHRWAALAVLCAAALIINVDNTILNVALPTLVRELHATSSQLQWIVDSYAMVFAGLLLVSGSLADRFGSWGCTHLQSRLHGHQTCIDRSASRVTADSFVEAHPGAKGGNIRTDFVPTRVWSCRCQWSADVGSPLKGRPLSMVTCHSTLSLQVFFYGGTSAGPLAGASRRSPEP
jgi:hypothetical protein